MKIAWLTSSVDSTRPVVGVLQERHDVTVLVGGAEDGARLLRTPDGYDLVVYSPGPAGPDGDAIRTVAAGRPGVVLLDNAACQEGEPPGIPPRSLGVVVSSASAREALVEVSPAPVLGLSPTTENYAVLLEEFLVQVLRQSLYLSLADLVSDVLDELGPAQVDGLTERLVTEIGWLHSPADPPPQGDLG